MPAFALLWFVEQRQRQPLFTESGPRIRLEFMERSGSFSHVEEPETVFALIREFSADGARAER